VVPGRICVPLDCPEVPFGHTGSQRAVKRPCSCCGKLTTSRSGLCKSTPECRRRYWAWCHSENRGQRNATCRAWYARNREQQVARSAAWHKANPERSRAAGGAHRKKVAAWLRGQKVGKSCVDCGLTCTDVNYVAFDWDHRPGVVKSFEISQSFRNARTQSQVLDEIAKCDLRCRNCHAIVTRQRRQANEPSSANPGRTEPRADNAA
jgi:hypothetical protein